MALTPLNKRLKDNGNFDRLENAIRSALGAHITTTTEELPSGVNKVRPITLLEKVLNLFGNYAIVEVTGEANIGLYQNIARKRGYEVKLTKDMKSFDVGKTLEGMTLKPYVRIITVVKRGREYHEVRVHPQRIGEGIITEPEYSVDKAVGILLDYVAQKAQK